MYCIFLVKNAILRIFFNKFSQLYDAAIQELQVIIRLHYVETLNLLYAIYYRSRYASVYAY